MIKVIALLRRRPDLSFEQFVEHWHGPHAAIIRQLPGLRRYIQNPAHPHPHRSWPYDGMAELVFDDVQSVKVAFESEAADLMRQDEQRFLSTVDWFLADEHVVVDTAGES